MNQLETYVAQTESDIQTEHTWHVHVVCFLYGRTQFQMSRAFRWFCLDSLLQQESKQWQMNIQTQMHISTVKRKPSQKLMYNTSEIWMPNDNVHM